MSGKIPNGEPLGIKFHGTMVVSGEATNQEKILYVVGATKMLLRYKGSSRTVLPTEVTGRVDPLLTMMEEGAGMG